MVKKNGRRYSVEVSDFELLRPEKRESVEQWQLTYSAMNPDNHIETKVKTFNSKEEMGKFILDLQFSGDYYDIVNKEKV